MKASDVAAAVQQSGLDVRGTCIALRLYALPILRQLRDRSSGWKLWVKIGLGIAIGALEAFVAAACQDAPLETS